MTTDNLIIGKRYSVSSNNDCVITDTATGYTLASLTAGSQLIVVPISNSITSDNDCVVLPVDETTVMPGIGQGGNGSDNKPTATPSPMGTSGVDFSYFDNSDPEHPVIRLDWPSKQYATTNSVDYGTTQNYESMYANNLVPSDNSGSPSFEMPTYEVVINAPELIDISHIMDNQFLNGGSAYIDSLHIENLGKVTNLSFLGNVKPRKSMSGTFPPTLVSGSMIASRMTDFSVELPQSLVDMSLFFEGCWHLENFSSSLQFLENGEGLFGSSASQSCNLSLASVQNIAETINDLAAKGKTGNITISYHYNLSPDDPELLAAIDKIKAKGWNVTLIQGLNWG